MNSIKEKNLKQGRRRAHVIVFGNEKGGSGKSTAAMHTAIGLMRLGYKVGTIDLDCHQGTLTSYMSNRWRFVQEKHEGLPSPEHIHIDHPEGTDLIKMREDIQWRVDAVIKELSEKNDFIVIDTPGSDRFISIVGHSYADTLVTPMNDSFVDMDLLAKIKPKSHQLIKPSVYAEMIMDLRRQRKAKGEKPLDWVVMRNRLSHIDARNKKEIGITLENLSRVLKFRVAPGFGERVIFRELFLDGLTLLDLKEGGENVLTMSNITARQEVRYLVKMLLPEKSVTTLSLLKTA